MVEELSAIGEVIEASTTEFAAECRTLHSPPPFGSFVKVLTAFDGAATVTAAEPIKAEEVDPFDSFRRTAGTFGDDFRTMVEGEEPVLSESDLPPAIYAVVHQACTSPVDSGRRLRAYWKDEQQLNEEQPELSEWLLVTEFHAIIIGYSSGGVVRQFLPPHPPKIHSFVHACTTHEIKRITDRMDFLRTLSNARSAPSEEVIAACIREASAARDGSFSFLVDAGKELAGLLKDDYDRLQAIMRRVAP